MISQRFLTLFEDFPAPAETLRRAVAQLRDRFQTESVHIFLFSPNREVLVPQNSDDTPASPDLAWTAVRQGYTVNRQAGEGTAKIAIPFGYQGESIGVIELCNVPKDLLAGAETEAHALLIASLIGAAYSTATLRSRLQLQQQALESANMELIQRVDERTAALQDAIRQVKEKNQLLRRTQTQLVQTEKMAALGQLAAGVAHEINNPIGFIASNLHSAKTYWQNIREYIEKVGDSTSPALKIYREKYDIELVEEDMQRLIEECLEGTTRVTNIVRNLKEFAHQGQSETRAFNVHELIDRTLAIALSPFKHRVEVRKEYGAHGEIIGDAQRVGQVILNLAVNAAQAIEDHGTILFRTFEEDRKLVIEVEDTGCGIPEENLTRVFEPFFTTKDVGVGTGLGLSTCFHLVHQSGGEIAVKSEVGVGTTFRLQFPLVPNLSV
jgi:signal transduction histidine kinase